MRVFRPLAIVVLICLASPPAHASPAPPPPGGLSVGVAKVDVTPDFPIRLTGYFARKSESQGIEEHLYARALAIGTDAHDACVLVTIDNTGIPASLTDAVAARLAKELGIPRERLTFTCTHTHCAPRLNGALVNLFGQDLTPAEQAHVDRYTKIVADKLDEAAKAAVADLKPATLALGRGSAGFAANRRTRGGPVEHEMPMLVARDPAGKVRAVLVNYACHCTTLGPDTNKTSGDWAGHACEDIEREYPGAVALVTIGCAGDANPKPRGTLAMALAHGQEIATEATRLIQHEAALRPVRTAPKGKIKTIELAYDRIPTRAEWEKLARRTDPVGYNARTQLAKLDRGETISPTLPYRVQTWTFGKDLAMVFLTGEVVVDYDLRLKGDYDPSRLWITAYANDVPCYIPSKRVLAEGGYEGEGAMVYYGRPSKFAPSVENDVIRAVHELVPVGFRSQSSLNEFPPGKSVPEALKAFKVGDDLMIDVAASEPLIESPVAIDWDAQGRLWVLEMYDYPSGLHEDGRPGGRVKVLESTHHDGHYDKATLFLDHISFPQGIMCWGKGVLICAAPNILYAEDVDGDGNAMGKKDIHKVLFSGFSPDNQQWEVNGLAWGLDNWVYGASSIHNEPIHVGETDHTIELGGRDFRMNPDAGAFEPAAGRTQFCRVRDDWGNWFGNDNSNPLWNYPLEDRYARRNPHVAAPPPNVYVDTESDSLRVFPASRLLERFNSPQSANRVTSGCGTGIYRDRLLGDAFYGNAFFCEPVHNVVERLILTPHGATFDGHRAPQNASSEFLASTDNWFRPVQVRTGPDGALWVVDMYRFVIEHPRWIPPDRLARLDVRAGADQGRIYRIYPKGATPRSIPNLDSLATPELARRIDDPNGTIRDIIHRELLRRQDAATATPALEDIAKQARDPAARLQALCALNGIGRLSGDLILSALGDANANVRRNAVRLAESRLAREPALADTVLKLVGDREPVVRYQVALSLGEWDDARVAPALGQLAARDPADLWMRAAVLSSATRCAAPLLDAFEAAAKPASAGAQQLVRGLTQTIAATGTEADISKALMAVTPADPRQAQAWQFTATGAVLDALAERHMTPRSDAAARVAATTDAARAAAANTKEAASTRIAAVRLLTRDPAHRAADLAALATLLQPGTAPALQAAAINALARTGDDDTAGVLVAAWPRAAASARPQLLDALTSRPAWAAALLAAIEKRTILASEVPANYRDKLLSADEPSLKARAQALLAALRASDRSKVIERFKPVLMLKGNPAAGAAIFSRTCTPCHQLNGAGHMVGPNLAALSDRSTSALMVDILDPNAAVAGEFVAYTVQTTDGRTLSGLIRDESATGFTIVQGNDLREPVARSSIKRLVSTGLSLMPEGLEEGMTPQDLADLISFVQSNDTPRTFAEFLVHPQTTDAQLQEALSRRPDLALPTIGELLASPSAHEAAGPRWIAALRHLGETIGQRDDDAELRQLLTESLPAAAPVNTPGTTPLPSPSRSALLTGLSEGLRQRGHSAAQRIPALLANDAELLNRWRRATKSSP
jgi:putative membrane-bound dehydrogenase-like protein